LRRHGFVLSCELVEVGVAKRACANKSTPPHRRVAYQIWNVEPPLDVNRDSNSGAGDQDNTKK
jgi:hypothetical protein